MEIMRKLLAQLQGVNLTARPSEIMRKLLAQLQGVNLTTRPSKCFIGYNSLECLGHVVGRETIQPTPDKIDAIRNAPQPKTKKQVKSFIGLASYHRKIIPNFTSVAVPLTDLTKKGMSNKVEWKEAQENSFTTLKKLPTSNPILRLPNMNQKFTWA